MVVRLGDDRVITGVSSETERDQSVVRVDPCGRRSARIADLHANAGDRIQPPRSYDRNYARSHLEMDNVAR
jgi:hypothetical protein